MAVSWLSGSAKPGASVNVAPGEEKSLCPGLQRHREGERRGPGVVVSGESSRVDTRDSVQKDQGWSEVVGLSEGLKRGGDDDLGTACSRGL